MNTPEITIYAPGTPFVHNVREEFEAGYMPVGDTFLRHIGVERYICAKDLGKLLGRAEEEYKKLEDICGIKVVPHSWGFIEVGEESPKVPACRLIPPEYNLVAEVQTIEIASPIDPYMAYLKKRIRRYTNRARNPFRRLTDIRPDQFAIGHPRNEPGEDRLYLLDFEPRFTII